METPALSFDKGVEILLPPIIILCPLHKECCLQLSFCFPCTLFPQCTSLVHFLMLHTSLYLCRPLALFPSTFSLKYCFHYCIMSSDNTKICELSDSNIFFSLLLFSLSADLLLLLFVLCTEFSLFFSKSVFQAAPLYFLFYSLMFLFLHHRVVWSIHNI